jgi:exonuclease III
MEMIILLITEGQVGFFVHQGIRSAVMTVIFISNAMSDVIISGHYYDIIDQDVHAPTEDKSEHKYSFHEELECVFDQLRKYHPKILLGDFSAKLGREDIENESLHDISNDAGTEW